jgi:superfamily I DNA and/or RNA helicase
MSVLKKLTAALLIVFPLVLPAQENEGPSIQWSADRKLTWVDYLANPDSGSDAAASTSTSIKFDYHVRNNHFTYSVACNFSKEKSWGRFRTNYILAHEQGHFDIAEIFARKLNKALENYSFRRKSYKKDLDEIYTSVIKEKDLFQQQYDDETDYSRNKTLQQQWLAKIRDLLNGYQPYAGHFRTNHKAGYPLF